MTDVQGFVAPGFEAVRDAFARNFTDHGDVGAQFALYRRGELVVDLAGGTTTLGGSQPYRSDHLQLVYSTTKGATAICAHVLAERGELDFDAPVTDYWPEFKAHGKADVPVSWLLSHQVGLPDVDRPMTYEQALAWDPVVEALADSVPMWEPGTQHGYHAVTYGWLVGELVRRISGKSLGTFFRQEIAEPLGLDFWIGLPDEQHTRVVPLIQFGLPAGIDLGLPPEQMPGMMELFKMMMGPDSLIVRALTAPGGAFLSTEIWEDPNLWRAELGAANGITNAASLAKLYAATVGEVDGVRLLSEATLANAIEPRVSGTDAVLMFDIPFGLGFMRDSGFSKFGSPSAFGHYGLGGSVGFGDAEAGIGFGFVMNKLELSLAGDPRTSDLIDAVYASL